MSLLRRVVGAPKFHLSDSGVVDRLARPGIPRLLPLLPPRAVTIRAMALSKCSHIN